MKRAAWSLVFLVAFVATAAAQDDSALPDESRPAPAAVGGPTYHRDVEAIFQKRCQLCHRPDAIGPFDLLTYKDALGNSAMIEEVVKNGRMPPWHASKESGPFKNKRALPDAERKAILDWVKNGAPKGDPTLAPPPVVFPDPKGWSIGEPDLVVETPRPFEVPASGTISYQYYDMPTNLEEDRWVTQWEVKVDAPEVVHHVLAFVVYPDRARSPRVMGGLRGYFASYLPGESLEPFAYGSAKFLPKGARLQLQVHYTTNGEAQTDRIKLAFKFAPKGTTPRRARTVALSTVRFLIPPNTADYTVRARYRFKSDQILMGLQPHMHVRGKSFKYLLIYPDGTSKMLLDVPKWDFNWQNTYRFSEPLFVPKGSKMVGVAHWDNSTGNAANPDPTKLVHFGEQTWDEMMIGYMDVVDATPEERATFEAGQPAKTKTKTKESEPEPKKQRSRSFK